MPDHPSSDEPRCFCGHEHRHHDNEASHCNVEGCDCEIYTDVHEATPAAESSTPQESIYPCRKCGKTRTKSEGGTTFTVCDECWDDLHVPPAQQAPSPQPVDKVGELEAMTADRDNLRRVIQEVAHEMGESIVLESETPRLMEGAKHWIEMTNTWMARALSSEAQVKELQSRETLLAQQVKELREALRGIIEIGKRDMSNPKYDDYFENAKAALSRVATEGGKSE